MRSVISLILVYCLAITSVFAQSVNPNDTLKIGKASSSSDKGLTFDTNDGVSNKKLLIEKISKKLKFDGNTFQIGDGSSSSDKELIIAGALKSLKYNGTSGEFEFNDDVKLSGTLKADFLQAVNTEVAINSLLRASQGIKVGAGANEIRVNAGNLEFSNDGVLYKKFGTGTGGSSTGISILENASFEDGITTGWTSSGGTFSQETYTNSVEGSTKYARFIATGAGQYFETTLKAIPDNFSGGCQADFKKINISGDDLFKVEVLDNSLNVLTFGSVKKSSWVKFPTINFSCPTAGSTVKLRVTSLASGTIEVDDAYLGSNQNLVNVSQAKLVGTLRVSGCQNSGSSTSWANFPATTGCTYSATGNITAPPTMTPSFVINKAQRGDYLIVYSGSVVSPLGGANARLRITDGNFISNSIFVIAGTPTEGASVSGNTVNYRYSRANYSESVTLTLQHIISSSSYGVVVGNSDTTEWSVWFYPSDSETAVSNEQSSWFIDANIGGANTTTSVTTSSYTEITNGSLDLIINNSKGSAPVEIACSGTNPSTGSTCATGSESHGIAFNIPSSGLYEACVSFSANIINTTPSANTASQATFQLIETPNNAQTIIQEGGERKSLYSYKQNLATGGFEIVNSIKVCGTFNFSSASKRTIRLMYESSVLNSGFTILGDRSASEGQKDVYWSVRPLLSAYNRPILTGDQVTSTGEKNPKFFGAKVTTTSGAITAGSNYGGTIISCTAANPSVCSFSTTFTKYASCWANQIVGNLGETITTLSNFSIGSYNSANGTAQGSKTYDVNCIGI